jgi:purine-binding chemotaxis protein CheW
MKNRPKSEPLPVLTFRLADQLYAAPIDYVVEVASMVELTTLPNSPPGVLGIANRHGSVLPVLDLRRVFELETAPVDSSTLFVVVTHDGQMVGLVVDEVHQVEYVNLDERRATAGKYIRDIVSHKGQLVQLIAVPQLLGAVGEGFIESP